MKAIVGDKVQLSCATEKTYPNIKLGIGIVEQKIVLLEPDYYGYIVSFPGLARSILIGQDALAKAEGGD